MHFYSKVRHVLRNTKLLKNLYNWLRRLFIGYSVIVSPVLFAKLRYRAIIGTWPDLKRPKSFDEKLLWLNLFWQHPLKTRCGDKYTMRSYVKENALENILPTLLGVFRSSSEIDFENLPERFVLKCTHGCGFNIICQDKRKVNIEEVKKKLDAWMKVDFSQKYGELHYSKMKPRIICEEFLDDLESYLPSDFKVFCFDGIAHCTMVCTGRTLNGRASYDFYDLEWSAWLPYTKAGLPANRSIRKPEAYDEIISAAKALSQPFPFVRMDFYSNKGRAVLGEMTFTPAGCIDVDISDLGQAILGGLLKLPDRYMG